MNAEPHAPSVSVVVLTMGDRPVELARLCDSLADQPAHDRLVVGNGVEPLAPAGWRTINTGQNLGVPGGRSFGLHSTTADIVLFIDDDAIVRSPDLIDRVQRHFATADDVGAIAFRIVEPDGEQSLRRWIPTPRAARTETPLDVPTYPGGGHALRRSAFEEVGGYINSFFFKHEETELSWRLVDAGWRIRFDPQAVIEHPMTDEYRHIGAFAHTMRNKTWLARLRLPQPLPSVTIVVSLIRTLTHARSRSDVVALFRGAREGLISLPAARKPIRWRTVWRLTRLGRPPIL